MNLTLNEISIGGGQYGGGFSAIEYEEGKPRYIRITDVTDDGGLNDKKMAASGSAKEWEKYLLEEGDLLFARSGATVGKSYLHRDFFGRAIFAGYMIRFRINQKLALPKYVFYYTRTPHYKMWVENKQNVVAQPNINAKQYGNELLIPLPPLAVQERIAAILDAADTLRQKDQALLKKYDDLTQSLFLDMFGDPVNNSKGWVVQRLENLLKSKSQNGLYVPKEQYSNEGVQMAHMSDAFYESLIPNDFKRVRISKELIKKYRLDSNDLLIARRSLNYDGAAKPCRVPDYHEEVVYESSLIRISPDTSKVLPIYLYFFLNNQRAREMYLLKHVTKSTISGINNKGLNATNVVVPSIRLQHEFAEKIAQIEKQKQQVKSTMKKSEDLFQSLLQRAFKGELVSEENLIPQ